MTTTTMTAWEKALLGVPWRRTPTLLPGLAVTALLAWISIALSGWFGTRILGFAKSPVSEVMVAILLGLLLGNLRPLPRVLYPGLVFAVKKLLRLGIILLGIRLSIYEVFQVGAQGLPIILLCVAGALLFTTLANRQLRLPARLGMLIAVGTSICGVSAIVAAAPVIEAEDEEVAYAVAVITVFGIVATLGYPYLANVLFGGDPVKAGLFLGTAIHDTSQVTGAGLVYAAVYNAPAALDVATVTKLVRNVLMAVVIPLMALRNARAACPEDAPTNLCKLLPMFIIGFVALAVVRSLGDAGLSAGGRAFGIWNLAAWQGLHGTLKDWAVALLVMALAGVGLSTRFSAFKGLGFKPFIVGLIAALTVGIVSWGAIALLVAGCSKPEAGIASLPAFRIHCGKPEAWI